KLTAGQPSDTSRIAALSAAVIDMARIPIDSGVHEGSIYASLLLSADIKGYVETPNRYFKDPDFARGLQLDNVMLTQGWSRIDWQDLAAGKSPTVTYSPEQALRISGVVTKRN